MGYALEWGDLPDDYYSRDEVVEFIAMLERDRRYFPNHPDHRAKLTPDERRQHKAEEAAMSEFITGCAAMPIPDLLRMVAVSPTEQYRRLASAVLATRLGLER